MSLEDALKTITEYVEKSKAANEIDEKLLYNNVRERFASMMVGLAANIERVPYGHTPKVEAPEQPETIQKTEYWQLKPYGTKGAEGEFQLVRFIDGIADEVYGGNKSKIAVYLAAIIEGFEPPRCLVRRA